MTVAELRALLADVPDHARVLVWKDARGTLGDAGKVCATAIDASAIDDTLSTTVVVIEPEEA